MVPYVFTYPVKTFTGMDSAEDTGYWDSHNLVLAYKRESNSHELEKIRF